MLLLPFAVMNSVTADEMQEIRLAIQNIAILPPNSPPL
jgi:hypothetical protein